MKCLLILTLALATPLFAADKNNSASDKATITQMERDVITAMV